MKAKSKRRWRLEESASEFIDNALYHLRNFGNTEEPEFIAAAMVSLRFAQIYLVGDKKEEALWRRYKKRSKPPYSLAKPEKQ